MSSILTIPVTPLVLSLYNQCKVNMKCEDKSNTDFLILLLNSATHIYSIVKEFSQVFEEAEDGTKESDMSENNDETHRGEYEASLSDNLMEPLANGIEYDTGVVTTDELKTPEDDSNTEHSLDATDVDEQTTLSPDEVDDTVKHLESELASLIANVQMPAFTENENQDSHINDHFENYVKKTGAVSVAIQGNKARYQCKQCPASFSFKHGLYRHLKNRSCGKALHKFNNSKCPHCFITILNQRVLKKHVINCKSKTLNLVSPYSCKRCHQEFSNSGNLKRHLKRKVCGDGETSPTLPFPTSTIQNIHKHSTQDTSEKDRPPMRLTLKPKIKIGFPKFTLASQLIKNVPSLSENSATENESSVEKSYTCSYCQATLASRKGLLLHHKEFRCRRKCTICDYSAVRAIQIQSHLKHDHNVIFSIEEIDQFTKDLYDQHMADNGGNLCITSDGNVSNAPSPQKSMDTNGNVTRKRKFDYTITPKSDFDEVMAKSDILKKCPVYECGFWNEHSGGFHTHVKYHFLKISKPTTAEQVTDCLGCDIIGIPLEKVDTHNEVCPKNKTDFTKAEKEEKAEKGEKPKKSYPCQHCDFVGKSIQSIAGHANNHSVKNPKKTKCDAEESLPAVSSGADKDDVKKETPKKTYACQYPGCVFVGKSSQSVGGHMNAHNNAVKKAKAST